MLIIYSIFEIFASVTTYLNGIGKFYLSKVHMQMLQSAKLNSEVDRKLNTKSNLILFSTQ